MDTVENVAVAVEVDAAGVTKPPPYQRGTIDWAIAAHARLLSRAIVSSIYSDEAVLSKNQNTTEKRRREIEKKRKAEEKRQKRQVRKEQSDDETESTPLEEDASDDS